VINFLAETNEAITESGHTPADVVFIGSLESGHRCTWAEFETLADFDYDNGFGSSKIATDLTVVFSDGQTMWRGEYDGSEWWVSPRPPVVPETVLPIRSFGGQGVMWSTLAEIDEELDVAAREG
jgi:hypothetical protein